MNHKVSKRLGRHFNRLSATQLQLEAEKLEAVIAEWSRQYNKLLARYKNTKARMELPTTALEFDNHARNLREWSMAIAVYNEKIEDAKAELRYIQGLPVSEVEIYLSIEEE